MIYAKFRMSEAVLPPEGGTTKLFTQSRARKVSKRISHCYRPAHRRLRLADLWALFALAKHS